jgi:hypothetical protein
LTTLTSAWAAPLNAKAHKAAAASFFHMISSLVFYVR